VDKAKKSVCECVELAEKLQSSAVCSGVARVSLHKQIKDLQTLAADVSDDWSRKRTELETELTRLENYYNLYQVCNDNDNDGDGDDDDVVGCCNNDRTAFVKWKKVNTSRIISALCTCWILATVALLLDLGGTPRLQSPPLLNF